MPNALTGDFDVVAEFGVLAVDRLLAAMHQTERFLHSLSARVDDNPHPTHPVPPVVIGVIDAFGDPVANHQLAGNPTPIHGSSAVTNAVTSHLGMLLNADVLAPPKVIPSHISGVAQIQVFPPTVRVPDNTGTNLAVRMNVMVRFIPDKNTAPLAEFIRGDLEIIAPINKVAVGHVHVIDIDFKADQASVNFTPSYTSQPLTAADLAGINLCIKNALQTAFLPSSVVLPSSITNVQLKTLPQTLAVMLDMNAHPSNPASVTNVFLAGDDDFAFAVGRDYLLSVLQSVSNNVLGQQFPPATFTVDLSVWGIGTTLHYSYPIQLNSASFDLKPPDKIVLTIQGHAGPEAHGHPPSGFSFTITVEFSLIPSGPTVSLQLGNVSIDTSSTIASILDYFTGSVTNSVRNAIANALANTNANALLDNSFNADKNLTNFLNAQLSPSDGSTPTHPTRMFMVYNSVEVQSAGIVLHGSLLTYDWPAPYIQFEQIPPNSTGPMGGPVFGGTDYSALKTWIPGGTITEYDWSMSGSPQPFSTDNHKFVLLGSGPVIANPNVSAAVVHGYSSLCLTVKGSRISNFGSPATFQQVQAKSCGFTVFPVGLAGMLANPKATIPMVAITQPGPSGGLVVTGHTPIQIDRSGAASPNLIVHFADAKSASTLETLGKAFSQSKRTDAPTAIIAVLPSDHLAKAPHVPGVIYTDDAEAWQQALNLRSAKGPLTAIVAPHGGVAWHEEGSLDVEKLSAALAKHLAKRGPVQMRFPRLNARIGQPAPNFVFEYAPARTMPLSKLTGKPAVLVFWKSFVKESIHALRDLQANEASGTTVLAINDGEDPKVALAAGKENGMTATVVTDPKREIAAAYGVTMWPTMLTVSESGIISGIKHGHAPGEKLTLHPRPVPTTAKVVKQK